MTKKSDSYLFSNQENYYFVIQINSTRKYNQLEKQFYIHYNVLISKICPYFDGLCLRKYFSLSFPRNVVILTCVLMLIVLS